MPTTIHLSLLPMKYKLGRAFDFYFILGLVNSSVYPQASCWYTEKLVGRVQGSDYLHCLAEDGARIRNQENRWTWRCEEDDDSREVEEKE